MTKSGEIHHCAMYFAVGSMRCGVCIVERRKARYQLSPETNKTKLWATVLPSWGSGGGYISPAHHPGDPLGPAVTGCFAGEVRVAAAVGDFI